MSGGNKVLGGGGFHHVAMRVRDFDRSLAFYTDTLGCTKKIAWGEAPKRAAMLDVGGSDYLELFEKPDHKPVEGEASVVHFALRCADVDSVLERVRETGATVTVEPMDVDIEADVGTVPVRIAFFTGPDGEVVELFHNEMT
jgi:catechol 2,3-dioxygenase-like lactoylglutathione lyase family enzyme